MRKQAPATVTGNSVAICFEPDAYMLDGKIMGRQSAGNAFLRAAIAGRDGQTLWGYTPDRKSGEIFGRLVRKLDRKADARWLPADRLDQLQQIGTLYIPSPNMSPYSRTRLHAGPAAYSLCGITHTLATHRVCDEIADLLADPVMPWDALICTSGAAVGAVEAIFESQTDYLQWRFGPSLRLTKPQLPVIPLGVHCKDFSFNDRDHASARSALNIQDDEVVFLFCGRLSFHAKAHPHAMYIGLEAAARRTGKKVVLLQCGEFFNKGIEEAFKEDARGTCPSIRTLFISGRDNARYRQCWASADIFLSLSDNIQETFGLTPVEAMASGLPVIVTDWNGYKDTVRSGLDGFRIPTWMPAPGNGQRLADAYDIGNINYDTFIGLTSQTTSVDLQQLIERAALLIDNRELRKQMGQTGKKRAQQTFDWTEIYKQYRNLWAHLAERRAAAGASGQAVLKSAPKTASTRTDPFRVFHSYPSRHISGQTRVTLDTRKTNKTYRDLVQLGVFRSMSAILPGQQLADDIIASLGRTEETIEGLAAALRCEPVRLTLAVSVLAKMGLVRVHGPAI